MESIYIVKLASNLFTGSDQDANELDAYTLEQIKTRPNSFVAGFA